MTSDKNIPVNFVQYEPYEHYPNHVAHLGHIGSDELNELMSVFNTNKIAQNACICSLNLSYLEQTRFGRIPGGNKHYCVLDIDGMFYFDQYPQCGKPNCQLDETGKIKRCARNLKNGKCRDEFIRKTLGVALFPEHYKKDKQK